ncbi:hypothetical protein CRENBAI_007021 [Crenichthys baileyi]|uniref:Late endosomal/lysosomal adaptor and MAPK and MTOR activator 5 n=1 Tax=Crenichthys baileyi TaxID=28760 RepID=A0AAV9RTL3_9TELE
MDVQCEEEKELLFVRFSHQGKIESKFVGIKSVEKADASHISQAICAIMDEVSDDWGRKLVALGTDGTLVMTRAKNGVVRLTGRI